MPRVRDKGNYWTAEAKEYTSEIEPFIRKMLDLGDKKGFNNEDIFYLIVSAVNEQQLLKILY